MNRKDYRVIAEAIRASNNGNAVHVVMAIADALQRDNMRFDRDKWLRATGVGG